MTNENHTTFLIRPNSGTVLVGGTPLGGGVTERRIKKADSFVHITTALRDGLHPAIRGDQCFVHCLAFALVCDDLASRAGEGFWLCGFDGFAVLQAQYKRPRAGKNLAEPPIADDIGGDSEASGQLANPARFIYCNF